MTDWNEIVRERARADARDTEARTETGLTPDEALLHALSALRMELRALALALTGALRQAS